MSKLFLVCEDCNDFVSPGNLRHAKHKTRDLSPDKTCGICEQKILPGEAKAKKTGKEDYHEKCLSFAPPSNCVYCQMPISPEMLRRKNENTYHESCLSRLFYCKECHEEVNPLENDKVGYDDAGFAHHRACLTVAYEIVSPKALKDVCRLWLNICVRFAQESEAKRVQKFRAFKAEQATLAEIKAMDGKLGLSFSISFLTSEMSEKK